MNLEKLNEKLKDFNEAMEKINLLKKEIDELQKPQPKSYKWEDLGQINGFYTNEFSEIEDCEKFIVCDGNKNLFTSEKLAKHAIALAQLSQLMQRYNGKIKDCKVFVFAKHISTDGIFIDSINESNIFSYYPFRVYFTSRELAENILKDNEQIIKDYLMID